MKKKPKKKKPKKEKNEVNNENIENEAQNNTNGTYSYDFLLKRLYKIMEAKKNQNRRLDIPKIYLEGSNTRKTWVNFGDVAKVLNRQKEHLLSYICSEFRIDASLGGEGQMYLKTKQTITEPMLKNILSQYIQYYVQCRKCKSYKTILKKDQSTRLPQIYCEDCEGEETIQAIKSRGGCDVKKKK